MESLFYISILLIIIIISSCNAEIFHILDISTDHPSVCERRNSTPTGTSKNNTQYTVLDLVHRYGACAVIPRENQQVYTTTKLLPPSLAEIFRRDELRLKSLQIRSHCSTNNILSFQYDAGGYMVRLGLGTVPKTQYVHLLMDTGSDVTWTQCVGQCFKQRDVEIFNPLKSASYSNMSCKDPQCPLYEDHVFACYRDRTCMYHVFYGDKSYTLGFLGKDTLDLDHAVIQNFIFGCSQNNNVTTGETDAGILGLSRHPLSLVSQIAPHSRQFSYCIPTNMHSMGYLTLGKNNANVVRFTPFTNCPSFVSKYIYCVEIMSINIGNTKLYIKQSSLVFKNNSSSTIVDSGTTFTYLPQAAYDAMSKEFNRQMDNKKYPLVPPGYDDTLNTCYNTSKHKSITHPLVSFTFKRNVTVNIDPHGTFIRADSAVVCLAFAADPDVSIFGNLAQMTHEVVYDISGNQLGFSSSSCV